MNATIAIIGLGQMGATYAKYASQVAENVVCFDYDKGQRLSFKERVLFDKNIFDPVVFDDIKINNLIIVEDIDQIWKYHPLLTIVTTHKDSHCYYSGLAMKNNSHVLTEKPLCISFDEAKEMQAISYRTRKKIYIGFSLHATPAFTELKKIINSTKFRELHQYKVYRVGVVPEDYNDQVSASFDLLCHDVDFCLQVFNQPQKTHIDETDSRYCERMWEYENFTIHMTGKLPFSHPQGFEYGYQLSFKDSTSIQFRSTDPRAIYIQYPNLKRQCIPLETISSCKKLLEKVFLSIINDTYETYLSNELSIIQGLNSMKILTNYQPNV